MSSLIHMLMDSSLVTSMCCTQYYADLKKKNSGAAGLYMTRVMKVLCFGDDFLYTLNFGIYFYIQHHL